MTYQNFLIAPFTTGLDTDLEPWLLPQEAFQDMTNFHLHHGVLEKRQGYNLYGYLVHRTQNWVSGSQTITNVTQASPGVVTTSQAHGLSDGDQVVITNSDMDGLNFRRFIVANSAATTFELTDSNGNDINTSGFSSGSTGTVYLSPNDPVMGMALHYDSSGERTLIAWNTKRACKWDVTNSRFEPLDVTASAPFYDYLNGDSSSFVSSVEFRNQTLDVNRLYFTNGVNYSAGPPATGGIFYYDPSSTPEIVSIRPDLVSGGSRKLDGAKFLLSARGSIFVFNTYEDGIQYPQRVRWCQNQNPDEWDDTIAGRGGYSDASTGESIIAGSNILDNFLVFFSTSIFALTPNSNPALPVKWERKNSFQACSGVAAKIEYDKEVITAGVRGIIGSTLSETKRVDQRIQNFMRTDVNLSSANVIFGNRDYINERSWLLYPQGTSTSSDRALILDEESSSWSIYDISMTCLGQGNNFNDSSLLMSDFPDPDNVDADGNIINPRGLPVFFNEFDEDDTMQSFWIQSDDLPFLGGDSSGGIHILENGGSDGGVSISGKIRSGNWNPFRQEGADCEWSDLKIFLSTHQKTIITIDFFKNDEQKPWKSEKIDCKPDLRERSEIVDATIKSPATGGVRIQAYSHGFSTGDICYVNGVEGMTQINGGPWTVTRVSDDVLDLNLDATGFDSYTDNGVLTELPWSSEKAWKKVPVGAIARDHNIRISSEGINSPVRIHAFMLKMRRAGDRLS